MDDARRRAVAEPCLVCGGVIDRPYLALSWCERCLIRVEHWVRRGFLLDRALERVRRELAPTGPAAVLAAFLAAVGESDG